ncbi:hypothetical protein EIP91_005948 [Steccherinum ochraceum]|uniref:F-box domain-containing protein n=1 Tax=Steccherinum ochraceum TaxID=92696 RepID=A0A4R0RMN7_9APHY|nr:hypothetical protein EIP91_005948 [Steccherinum ochraceum]
MMAVLLSAVDNTTRMLSDNPAPIFQRLLINHLPPELLHIIFDQYLDQYNARRLGSTCRLFRDIAMTYIYRSCNLRYRWLDRDVLFTAEDEQATILSVILHAQEDLLEQMQAVLADPFVLASILEIYLSGPSELRENLDFSGFAEESEERQNFYAPLNNAFQSICCKAVNAQRFKIVGWEVPADMMETTLSMTRLRTLEIMDCRIWDDHPETSHLTSSHISNVHFAIRDTGSLPAWNYIASLPHLQFLLVKVLHNARTLASDHHPPIPVFRFMKRFLGLGIFPWDTWGLAAWIRLAKLDNGGQLPLTHFKIESQLRREHITSLLQALAGAALKNLSLDGIHWATTELLVDIGRMFPTLEFLSLELLQSNRQMNTRTAKWPQPSWEYAAALQHFPKLKHFAWNRSDDLLEISSGSLVFFEDGWPTGQQWSDPELRDIYMAQAGFIDDWECVAKLFAVKCGSLEMVSFTSGGSLLRKHYIIQRLSGGRAHVEPCDDCPPGDVFRNFLKENPDQFDFSGWMEPSDQ